MLPLRYFMFLPSLLLNELSVAIVLFKPEMVVDISIVLDWHGMFFILNSCFVAELMVRTLKHMNVGHMRSGNIFRVSGLIPVRKRLAVVVVGQFMMTVVLVLFHELQLVFVVELVHFIG